MACAAQGQEIPASPLVNPVLGFSTYLGGRGFDVATDVAVDAKGAVYVAGYTNSADANSWASGLALAGGGTCGGGLDTYPCFDVFVARLDPTGRRLEYYAQFGGSGDDYATDIAVDSSGSVHVTGYTNSPDFPTAHPVQAAPGGGTCGGSPCFDAFVVTLDASGAGLEYATYLGGSGEDFGQGIAVDAAGHAVVTGFTASSDFPTQSAWQAVHRQGTYDAFLVKVDATGSALVYSTFLGGSGEDFASKVALDSAGAAYLTGYTDSPDFPVANALQRLPGGGTCGAAQNTTPCFDGFAAKLSADGAALVYSTYLGGSGGDYGYGIAVDDQGSAYLTGLTTSTDFPVTPGAPQSAGGGTSVDAFVVKLAADGSRAVYSTYLGGAGADAGQEVVVDSDGNATIAGYTYGAGFPLTNPLQAASGGFYDAFIAKLNAAGSAREFSTYLGGSGNEKARGLALDAVGNAYVAGETFSENFPTTSDALQTLYGGGAFDGFVAKIIDSDAIPGTGVVSPSKLTFADQLVGTSSAPQTVLLSNSGDLPLAISSLVVSDDFELRNECGASVGPSSSCAIQVIFAPGERDLCEGALTVIPEAPATPLTVSLTGKGVAPEMNLSHSAIEFGPQVVSTMSAEETITLANWGDAYLALSGVQATGDFSQTNNCADGLLPNQSCSVRICFTPTASGARTGSLTFTNSMPLDVAVVELSGTGSDFSISSSPETRSISAGEAATFTLSLNPAGGFHETVTLRCDGAPRAASCTILPSSTALDGVAMVTATVTVTTTASSRAFPASGRGPRGHFPNAALYLSFAIVATLTLSGRGKLLGVFSRHREDASWRLRSALALTLAAFGLACGGGGVAPPPAMREGTPHGTYELTITATSGPLTHTSTLTIVVQ
ncbi:MAG: SBBP repeat-containing protein [Terriglobia bacterium]